jgi:erythromycin esterase-like protein
MREPAVPLVATAAIPLQPERFAAPLIDLIGDADIVIIGGATHGSHEFYRLRADLTRALVEWHGFNVLAADVDWRDAYRVNAWVRHACDDLSAADALDGCTTFPRWSWRNRDLVRFLDWVRDYNARQTPHGQAGIYGLDVFSVHRTLATLIRYLRRVDPAAADHAGRRYGCFDIVSEESQSHGVTMPLRLARGVEQDLVRHLAEQARQHPEYRSHNVHIAAEEAFAAGQHARAVQAAEVYYRTLLSNALMSWNLRTAHMLTTLEALLGHAVRMSGRARTIVWAHNALAGDARGTRASATGEVSLGQLARERFGRRVCLIGFTTHAGSVTAAPKWGAPTQLFALRPSRRDSYEHLFHETGLPFFALDLHGSVREALLPLRLQRAIGAVYRPDSERWSHYSETCLPRQFDIVIHVDETSGVEPLEPWAHHDVDVPETWPAGV